MLKLLGRHKRLLTTLFVAFLLMLVSSFMNERYRGIDSCLDDSHINFSTSGNVDTYSQWRKLGPTTYVFTAYLDEREPCSPLITVLGFGETSEPPLYATLVRHNGAKIYIAISMRKVLNPAEYHYTQQKLGPYAYLWPLPAQITTANTLKSVVVEQPHNDTGKTEVELPITLPVFSTRSFGVCVHSPLFGSVKPLTVIHNIEINKVLGAEWFTFYIHNASQSLLEVLHEYASEDTIEVVLNWGVGWLEQFTHYFGQTLSINECMYRNMHRVKYLVYADLDEFIVPKLSLNWEAMMNEIENFKFGTYLFRHAYFFSSNNVTNEIEFICNGTTSVAKLPAFLSHVARSKEIYPAYQKSKCIIRPLHTSIIGVHEVFQHAGDFFKTYIVPPHFALLHHYRYLGRQGMYPVPSSLELHLRRNSLLDRRTFVFNEKIIASLRKRLCSQ